MNIYAVKISFKEGSKTKKEEYIVEAVSSTDVEVIITKEKEGIEVTINSTSLKDKLSSDNLIENGNGTFYACVITFLDDSSEFLYVEASSFDDAKETLEETRTELTEINSIKKTSILDILRA